jgi:hypothetical protein
MQDIQPRTLSNAELIRYATLEMDLNPEGMPLVYQIELLRRFNLLAPLNEYPPVDPKQLDLFK